jgi:hypothetical protein
MIGIAIGGKPTSPPPAYSDLLSNKLASPFSPRCLICFVNPCLRIRICQLFLTLVPFNNMFVLLVVYFVLIHLQDAR